MTTFPSVEALLHSLPGKQTSCRRPVITRAFALSATLLLALSIPALTGCGGQTSYPTAITVSGLSNETIDPGTSANFSAVVTGGPLNAGVTWSLTGCTASACGTLSNITTSFVTYTAPTTVATTFTVMLTAAAVGKPTVTQTVTLTVPGILTITTPAGALPGATFGSSYTTSLSATGGVTPYTWSISQGALPAGLSISSTTGAISGVPTSAGTASFTVTLTDSSSPALTTSSAFTLTVTAVAFQGQVLSGTTPVNGASIQLYAAGATGNASAATPMLTQTVITDALGMFQLTGNYTCGQSNTGQTIPATAQLYLVATGGTTSTTSTTSNPALTMVTAVGPCTNLTATSFDTLNELTTASAAWALAPFASSATTVGASSTNTLGLTNAFLDAALLANPSTGTPATLPANLTVESAKLAALADALSTCATTPCSTLFTAATPPSGTVPTDTFTAALNIAHNPGQNVAAIFATIPTTPPFATTLTASPNDWTMSLTVTGGGLTDVTALGIDSQNNIWVANLNGPLSVFNPQGTPLVSTGLTNGNISEVYGLAVDTSNNVWVTHTGDNTSDHGAIGRFNGVNDPATFGNYGPFFDTSIQFPNAIAADTNGNMYIANSGDSSATVLNSAGGVVAGGLGAPLNLVAFPLAIAIDSTHGFWLSGETNVVHYAGPNATTPGSLLANVTCCGQSYGMATDASGNLWVADFLGNGGVNGAVAEIVTDSSGNSTAPISGLNTGGISYPISVAVDAAQNVWFSNSIGDSITELAGSANTLPAGTALSPSTGVHGNGGFGLDASLSNPFTLLPDRSGNLWVSNEGLDAITMFFGLAAPTLTPLQPTPTAP